MKKILSIPPLVFLLGITGQAYATPPVDNNPPEVACIESVNPHGQTIPPAGSTTLPGVQGSGAVFGPFQSGSIVKITEDPEGVPEAKKIGSTNGQAGAVDYHLILLGDPAVFAVDASGNTSNSVACFVPPPPK